VQVAIISSKVSRFVWLFARLDIIWLDQHAILAMPHVLHAQHPLYALLAFWATLYLALHATQIVEMVIDRLQNNATMETKCRGMDAVHYVILRVDIYAFQ
jgi:hypothetical protein